MAVTTLPIVADLVGVLPVARWVYYCVDDFSLWPGLDGAALRRMEEQLVRRVDDVIAVSETLRDQLARMGRTARLLTHGVEPDFWAGDGSPGPISAKGLERPLVCGVPRGGVLVAAPIAEALGGELDVVVVRKVGAPGNPELGLGAVGATGPPVLDDYLLASLRVAAERTP